MLNWCVAHTQQEIKHLHTCVQLTPSAKRDQKPLVIDGLNKSMCQRPHFFFSLNSLVVTIFGPYSFNQFVFQGQLLNNPTPSSDHPSFSVTCINHVGLYFSTALSQWFRVLAGTLNFSTFSDKCLQSCSVFMFSSVAEHFVFDFFLYLVTTNLTYVSPVLMKIVPYRNN